MIHVYVELDIVESDFVPETLPLPSGDQSIVLLPGIKRLWKQIASFNQLVAVWQHLNTLFQLITAIAK